MHAWATTGQASTAMQLAEQLYSDVYGAVNTSVGHFEVEYYHL